MTTQTNPATGERETTEAIELMKQLKNVMAQRDAALAENARLKEQFLSSDCGKAILARVKELQDQLQFFAAATGNDRAIISDQVMKIAGLRAEVAEQVIRGNEWKKTFDNENKLKIAMFKKCEDLKAGIVTARREIESLREALTGLYQAARKAMPIFTGKFLLPQEHNDLGDLKQAMADCKALASPANEPAAKGEEKA